MENTNKMRGPWDVFKYSVDFYKRNFKSFIWPSFGVVFFLGLLQLFFALMIVINLRNNLSDAMSPFEIILLILYSITNLSAIVFAVISYLGYVKNIPEYENTENKLNASTKKIISDGAKLFWPLIVVTFISGFILIGSSVLFVIPAIIFAIYLSVWKFIIIFEGKRGMEALTTSIAYVKDNWSEMFWRIFVFPAVIGIIVMFIIQIIDKLVFYIVELINSVWLAVFVGVTYNIFTSAISILVIVPILYVYTYNVYKDLKNRNKSENEILEIAKKSKKWIYIAMTIGILAIIAFVCMLPLIFNSKMKNANTIDYRNMRMNSESWNFERR